MWKRIVVAICVAIFSGFLIAYLTVPRILEKDLKEYKEINYNENYNYDYGRVVYGSILSHKEIEPKTYGVVNTSKIGTYEVTYVFEGALEFKQEVRVIDTEKPKIILEDDILEVCPNGKVKKDIKMTAEDEYDGDITDKVEMVKEANYYYLEVEDSSGNMTIEDLNTKVIDNKPELKLNGKKAISLYVGDKYTDQGAKVTDDCDTDIKVVTSGKVDTSKEGTYKITYSAKDSSNNEVKLERTVTVSKLKKRPASVPKVLVGKKIIYLT